MYLNEAKIKLLDAGYRIIKENSDVYSDIREILMDDGYSEEKIEDLMMKYNNEIEDFVSIGESVFNKPGREGVLLKLDDGWCSLLQHNHKPNQKFKAFDYIVQNGGKNVPLSEIRELCYNGNNLNCYTQLEGCFRDKLLTVTKVVGIRKFVSITPKGMKLYKATADYLAGKPVKNLVSKEEYKDWYYKDVDSNNEIVQESIEDIEGLTRGPRGQQGTDDWSDFKDDFRAQTLILKKTLTPKFVSGLIKDMDFEIDSKDIKDVAIKMLGQVKDTKNPVENLQAHVRKYFTK